MTEENGHSLAATYDCKSPNCTGTARSRVGRYSYCDDCQHRRGTRLPDGRPTSQITKREGGTLVEKLDSMKALARQADAADAKARKLTKQALEAKAKADALRQQVAAAMREIAGSA